MSKYLMDSLEAFAQEANRFAEWAIQDEPHGSAAVRNALVRISLLYNAALQLPPAWTDDLQNQTDSPGIDPAEIARIVAYKSIPLKMYGEVFNPLAIPPEEPVIGSLIDDIVDIYRDVVTGLRAYQRGDYSIARWEWGFNFAHHWGEHATGAIRALHAWLAAKDLDKLAKTP